MAKYDYGGGCPCGLYRECIPQCENHHPSIVAMGKEKQDKRKKAKMEEDDFGFSIVDESELTTVIERNDKAEQLRDMIMPLLKNLKSNPDKDIIKWAGPDRVRKIDEFIKKMNKLVDG
jgi:hypothetical protein